MTFFAITQRFLDESFSSSNSTKISMRQFYAQIFMTIGSHFQELSYKRSDGHTDRFYSVLTFRIHKKRMLERARRIGLKPAPALVWVKQFFIKRIRVGVRNTLETGRLEGYEKCIVCASHRMQERRTKIFNILGMNTRKQLSLYPQSKTPYIRRATTSENPH